MNKNRQKIVTIATILIIAFGLYYFFRQKPTNVNLVYQENVAQDQAVNNAKPEPVAPVFNDIPEIGEYYLYTVSETETINKLKKDLGTEKFAIVLAINHIDSKFVKVGTKLVIPTKFPENIGNFLLDYSPFPKNLAELASVPKIILISQKIQYVAAYENGVLVYSAPVSTGKKSTQTPNGLFTANWKAKKTTSTVDDAWILPWYINLDNFEGISMHQYELPGYPASHSCIRMREVDAKWFYDFVNQWQLTPDGKSIAIHGTPVLIFDSYEYDKVRPWYNLVSDPNYLNINEIDLNNKLQPFMDKILNYSKEVLN
jgi:LysM repeat protein